MIQLIAEMGDTPTSPVIWIVSGIILVAICVYSVIREERNK